MTLKLTMLGTGTSHGVPEIGCHCSICKSPNPRNKRLRTAVWLHDENRSIVIDCSSDFRQQALTYDINRLDAILVTHTHRDHVGGLDDTRSLNAESGRIPLYLLETEVEGLTQSFYYVFEPTAQRGGGIPQIDLKRLGKNDRFIIRDIQFQSLLAFHGVIPILGYRFGNTAYLTDVKSLPESTIEKLKGINQLIINSLRYREHPTHMNLDETLDLLARIKPKKAYLTHTNHDLDYETVNKELPAGVELAYDGLELEIALP